MPSKTLFYSVGTLKRFGTVNYPTSDTNSLAYKQLQLSDLYSDKELKNSVGNILYDVSVAQSGNSIIDQEISTINLTHGTINFIVSIGNTTSPAIFGPGNYEFDIVSGTGKFLGVKGTVKINVSNQGLRTLTVEWK